MQIHSSNNPAREAGIRLNAFLQEHEEREILLLVSGGSALSILEYVEADLLGPHVTFGMQDERYSLDPKVNNFLQLKELPVYKKIIDADVSIIDSSVLDDESPEELAERLNLIVGEWITENHEGLVMTICGVGADGHTAGMFSFPEDKARFSQLFENPDRFFVSYNAGEKNQFPLRVTVTATFIRRAVSRTIVFATGEGKRDAITCLLNKDGSVHSTPARLLLEVPHAELFTDLKF